MYEPKPKVNDGRVANHLSVGYYNGNKPRLVLKMKRRESIGQYTRRYRLLKGLTIPTFAKLIRVAPSTLLAMEQDKRITLSKLRTMIRIKDIDGINLLAKKLFIDKRIPVDLLKLSTLNFQYLYRFAIICKYGSHTSLLKFTKLLDEAEESLNHKIRQRYIETITLDERFRKDDLACIVHDELHKTINKYSTKKFPIDNAFLEDYDMPHYMKPINEDGSNNKTE